MLSIIFVRSGSYRMM